MTAFMVALLLLPLWSINEALERIARELEKRK